MSPEALPRADKRLQKPHTLTLEQRLRLGQQPGHQETKADWALAEVLKPLCLVTLRRPMAQPCPGVLATPGERGQVWGRCSPGKYRLTWRAGNRRDPPKGQQRSLEEIWLGVKKKLLAFRGA